MLTSKQRADLRRLALADRFLVQKRGHEPRQAAAERALHHSGAGLLLHFVLLDERGHGAALVKQDAAFTQLFQHRIRRALFPAERLGGQPHKLAA